MKNDLTRRLRVLENILQPGETLAAKIEALTPSEREIYQRWEQRKAAWFARYSKTPDHAYSAMLDGLGPSQLLHELQMKLFGRSAIPANATAENIAEIYNEFREGSAR